MSIFGRIAEVQRRGDTVALATVVRVQGSVPRHPGSKMLVFPDGRIEGTIGGGEMESRVIAEARAALADGETRLLRYELSDPKAGDPGVCGGEVEVFVEPMGRGASLLVVGAGHVGRAVVHLGKWLGFHTVVCDDRSDFASKEAVPEADEFIVCSLAELPQRYAIDAQTYVVLTTRGVNIDVEGLPPLLDTPAAFLGVIGSRRRWETAAQELANRGVPIEKLARVVSPMGLELNAETPEEIAVSILAEIIMLRRGGSGVPMRHDVRPRREARGV
ncbi:MAG TPA: XdhC family protein [Anaerolineales bacterium]|nr:XdhC family protein [Anaerolineales bacterium]